MRSRSSGWLLMAALLLLPARPLITQEAIASTAQSPTALRGIDGILSYFQTFPIVGIEDWHGLAQEEDFYVRIIKDPRFSKQVGNIVVEFGGAAQQATIDRYIAGDDVPYDRLRAVWTDTVGWLPTVTSVGYLNVFAQIREVNKALAPSDQIHVWLGEPPIDWSKVKSTQDLAQIKMGSRDRYPADLIKSQILAKHKRALVIYGVFHFHGFDSMRGFVEKDYPNSFFVIAPYVGYEDKTSSGVLEQFVQTWRERSSTGGEKAEPVFLVGKGLANHADALLYLGPAASLTKSPIIPDIYLDEDFRREIDRRSMILTGSPLQVDIPQVSPTFISK